MAHDPIGDAIRNLITLQRLGNGLSHDAARLIDQLFADIAAQIARIDPASPKAARWRRERLAKLLGATEDLTGEAFERLQKQLRAELAGIGVQQAGWAAEQLELDLRAPLGAVAVDVRAGRIGQNLMKSVLDTEPIYGQTLAQWAGRQRADTLARIRQQVQLGMAQNETIDDMVRRVRGRAVGRGRYVGGVMQTTTREATTLVRTAVNHISNTAHMLTYQENADILSGVQWTATLDGRTCAACGALDGKVWPLDSPDRRQPPLHPNDRCALVPVIDWEGMGVTPPEDGTRASDSGQVPSATKYEEWLRGQPPGFQNDVLGPSRAQLFRQGRVSLADLVASDGTIIRVRDLGSVAVSAPAPTRARPRPRKLQQALSQVEDRIRTNPTEIAYAFDLDGNEVLVKGQGRVDQVSFTPAERRLLRGTVLTHNHPRSSSFSPADVAFAIDNDLQEIRAVGRAYRYRLIRAPEGWKAGLSRRIINMLPGVEDEVIVEFLDLIQRGDLTRARAELLHFHEVWTRIAARVGLDYRQEEW